MENNLFSRKLKESGVPFLIMTHRGQHGGNIIMNTLEAIEIAIKSGSDIVEIDVCRSVDGDYYLFHDSEELRLYGIETHFSELTSEFIDSNSLLNSVNTPSGYYAVKFEDFLNWLPEGVLINIDRSWTYWEDPRFIDLLMTSQKLEQLFFKSPVKEGYLSAINSWPESVNYMPIMYTREELSLVESFKQINVIGLELIIKDFMTNKFDTDWIAVQQEKYLIMFNAEDLGLGFDLFDNLSDTGAILGNPNEHWGVMSRMGGTIIQTDWPHFMLTYRNGFRN